MTSSETPDAVHRALRPLGLVSSLAGAYLVTNTLTSVVVLVAAFDELAPAVGVWLTTALLVALPMAIALAAVAHRADVLLDRHRPTGWPWLPTAAGAVLVAHFLPLCVWSPVQGLAVLLGAGRASRHLDAATAGVIAWVACAVGVALLAWGLRALRARAPGRSTVAVSTTDVSLAIATFYLLATAVPALGVVAWAAKGDAPLAALAGWGGLGMVLPLGLGWLVRRNLEGGGMAVAGLPLQVRALGAGAHWLVPYAIALTPALERDGDLRFISLGVAVVAAVVGTAVWAGSVRESSPEGRRELVPDAAIEGGPAGRPAI